VFRDPPLVNAILTRNPPNIARISRKQPQQIRCHKRDHGPPRNDRQ